MRVVSAVLAVVSIGSGQAWAYTAVDNPAQTVTGVHGGPLMAIVDSGVDYTHPKLIDHMTVGWDYKGNDALPFDYLPAPPPAPKCNPLRSFKCFVAHAGNVGAHFINLIRPGAAGHGTHVAGIAAGVSGNGRVLPLRIDYGSDQWIVHVLKAARYAVESGARVVNMSFGSYEDKMSSEEKQGMRELRELMRTSTDVLFVIAAGNDNTDMTRERKRIYPGGFNLDNVVTVGAVDKDGKLAAFSNVGAAIVDVYAPGVDVESTWPGGEMQKLSGTSMATPFIVGLAARILDRSPELTAAQVREKIVGMAKPLTATFKKLGKAEKDEHGEETVTTSYDIAISVILEADLKGL